MDGWFFWIDGRMDGINTCVYTSLRICACAALGPRRRQCTRFTAGLAWLPAQRRQARRAPAAASPSGRRLPVSPAGSGTVLPRPLTLSLPSGSESGMLAEALLSKPGPPARGVPRRPPCLAAAAPRSARERRSSGGRLASWTTCQRSRRPCRACTPTPAGRLGEAGATRCEAPARGCRPSW
jgi:hypothetical protein